jgi:RNA polymerase sigma factor (sigma-70 family)
MTDEFIPTRESLLSRLKDWSDQESWRNFFETYWRLIYRAALKAGLTETEAQDVVQETLISVAKKMAEFKYDPAIDSFKGWLFYRTRLRIADQFRNRRRIGVQTRPLSTNEHPCQHLSSALYASQLDAPHDGGTGCDK